MEFGKNRVQYKDMFWQYYRFRDFDCYFYQGGEDLAMYTGKKAAEYMPQLTGALDYTPEDPLQFIVYNTHSDFKQSNIGLNSDESANIGGTTRIVGNKIFVYFEGDHKKLDLQIRAGIAQVIVNQMMYGGSLRDMVRSSTLLNLPEWYLSGLVSYLGENWNEETDNAVKDGVLSGKYEKFNQLEGNEARLAGHSIWNYIAEVYGEKVIPNILYMTRVTRNVESGFLFVLGMEMNQLTDEFLAFYGQRYQEEEKLRSKPDLTNLYIKNKKERVYQQFKISPNGQYAAYVTNQLGQYRVYLRDLENGHTHQIIKGEHKMSRLTDQSYPALAWSPNGEVLAFALEKKGKTMLNFYYIDEKKLSKREVFQLEKILSMDYSNDGKIMVLSGVYHGQTDLYKYYIVGNRQEQLTNDIYDDLQPKYVNTDKDILFVSNRPNDTLDQVPVQPGLNNKDVYLLTPGNAPKLSRITTTPEENEEQPSEYGFRKYSYLSNKNGVINRFFAQYDSTIASVDTTINYRYYSSVYPLSNYNRNILEYNVNLNTDQYSVLMYADGKYKFFQGKVSEDEVVSLAEMRISGLKSIKQINFDDPSKSRDLKSNDNENAVEPKPNESETYKVVNPQELKFKEINLDNYQFGEVKPEDNKLIKDTVQAVVSDVKPQSMLEKLAEAEQPAPEKRNYNINFATDQVQTQVDNTYNNQFYQLLTGPDNLNPGLSGFVKMGASDLFEDYRITGGYRTSLNLGSMDYMLAFQDLKRRTDRTYFAQRQSQLFSTNTSLFRVITYSGLYEQKYPLSEVASIRGSLTYRNDQIVLLSTDQFNLQQQNQYLHQAGAKIEYVYDNTLKKGLNLYNGTRFKAFAQYLQEPGEKKSDMQVIGFDFRHYEKIHRSLILATRLSASTSVGNRRLLYFLGGVDRWLYLPKSDESTPPPTDERFYYQALAAPVRGALKNVRNGNSFALLNTELRWPVIKYFSNKPLRSDFLESFQMVAFSDIGTAWTGRSPWADDNQFNITRYPGNPISVTVRTQREPIVAGYGFGLRGRLLGYFLRADWAWAVLDGKVQPREFYISLSLDF